MTIQGSYDYFQSKIEGNIAPLGAAGHLMQMPDISIHL